MPSALTSSSIVVAMLEKISSNCGSSEPGARVKIFVSFFFLIPSTYEDSHTQINRGNLLFPS